MMAGKMQRPSNFNSRCAKPLWFLRCKWAGFITAYGYLYLTVVKFLHDYVFSNSESGLY